MIHNTESLLVVAAILGLFLLALFCLACSLSGGEVLNCSALRKRWRRCCCRCCKKQNDDAENDDEEQQQGRQHPNPPSYENLNEFIFESENDSSTVGILTMNNGSETPTTMQQLFPDLLGGSSPDDGERKRGFFSSPPFRRTTSGANRGVGTKSNGEHLNNNGGNENNNTIRSTTNAELQEPLL